MKWKKAPQELIDLFDQAIADFRVVEKKKMFGYPCIFVNGNLTAGLYQDTMMMRLSETDRKQFLLLQGASVFEPMPGRPMKEYVMLPPAVLNNPAKLKNWLKKSIDYARTLPAKSKAIKTKKK
jgi:TfoX/Sxy family transcriptional regulator of competence genes